jgi:SAM-dependent methyltransferase
MADSATSFTGTVPVTYHEGLGPLLFEPYATEVATRVPHRAGLRLLETACGTGIATRRVLEAVATAQIVAIDLNPDMLAVARRYVEDHRARMTFVVGDMTSLPFADASFDVVICQFGLMFVPDKPVALREARRVLRVGGTLLVSTWASMDRNPVVRITHETILEAFPDDPPRFYETPFNLVDPEALGALVRSAGFGDVQVDLVEREGRTTDARTAARALIEGNPVADAVRARGPESLPRLEDEVARRIADVFGRVDVRVPLAALMTTATA